MVMIVVVAVPKQGVTQDFIFVVKIEGRTMASTKIGIQQKKLKDRVPKRNKRKHQVNRLHTSWKSITSN